MVLADVMAQGLRFSVLGGEGGSYSSGVAHMLSTHDVLDSIPSTTSIKKKSAGMLVAVRRHHRAQRGEVREACARLAVAA